ncbi:hypothetical protein HID58_025194 [Brassica napus]|uniref:Uncharacterized protein n=1 Tax=Brassica napus TaxID=3708 RepID=A0ABQ8CKE9_BRANA|nr:hypothetical protein HID58_025194 [Brassica napus]
MLGLNGNVATEAIKPTSMFFKPTEYRKKNKARDKLLAFEAIPKLGIAFREPVVGAGHDCPRMCKSYFKRNGMTGVSLSVINKELGKVVLEWEAQGKVVEVEEAESQGKGKRKKTQKSVGKGKKQKTK